ncbi:MAG: hypothetical protein R3F62_04700 [Planctomycetota bacterium]
MGSPRPTTDLGPALLAWAALIAGAGLAIQVCLGSGPLALLLAAAVAVGCGSFLFRDASELPQRLVLAASLAGVAALLASASPGLAAACWGAGVALSLTRAEQSRALAVRALAGGWAALAGSFAVATLDLGIADPALPGLLAGAVAVEGAFALRRAPGTPARAARELRAKSALTRPLLEAALADHERALQVGADSADALLSELVRACSEAERLGAAAAAVEPGDALRGFDRLSAARRQAQEALLEHQAAALAEAERLAVDLALLSAPAGPVRLSVEVRS